MRRKLGILFLIGITVLAGTQEAARQFDGLRASLKDFTRASLWSGLIVYAQPVNDGKLPTPQIYYLMPSPQQPSPAVPAAQQQPLLLADNDATTTTPTATKSDGRNNHGGEAVGASSNPETNALAAAAREVEAAVKSELAAADKVRLNASASPLAAPKSDKTRVYEEVARNETHAVARRFRQEADVLTRVFVKDFDATKFKQLDTAKLIAEAEQLLAQQGQLEQAEPKSRGEAGNPHRRMEFRFVRRPAPPRPERIKVTAPFVTRARGITLPEMSSIGCEKTTKRATPEAAAAAAPKMAQWSGTQASGELASELGLQPVVLNPAGNSWTLNCDTEPEQN